MTLASQLMALGLKPWGMHAEFTKHIQRSLDMAAVVVLVGKGACLWHQPGGGSLVMT